MAHLPPVPNQNIASAEADPHVSDEEDRRYVHERLIFFSDAVIAIAMTLLALELPLPKGRTDSEVWRSFGEMLHGEYLSFIISFAVIGAFWGAHHQFFRKIHVVDPTLRRLNLLWLFLIVIQPFATRVNSEEADFSLGPVLYAIVISATALVTILMARHATRTHLLRAAERTHPMRELVAATGGAGVVFLLSIPVSFASPSWGRNFWLLTIVVSAVANRVIQQRRVAEGAAAD
jgi:uncharacterized membrane protein